MNLGTSSKNLTDGLLIAMAFFALIGLITGIVKFEEPYVETHPVSEEEITVNKALDSPYVKTFLILSAAFSITAAIGLGIRKVPIVSVIFSVALIVLSIYCFSFELVKKNGFSYVFVAVVSLCGNLIYTYFDIKDKRALKKARQIKGKKVKSNE